MSNKVRDFIMAALVAFSVLSVIAMIGWAVILCGIYDYPPGLGNALFITLLWLFFASSLFMFCHAYVGYKPYPHIHQWRYDFIFERHFARTCTDCHEHQISWNYSPPSDRPAVIAPNGEMECGTYNAFIEHAIATIPQIEESRKKERERERKRNARIEHEMKKCKYKPLVGRPDDNA